MKTSSGIPADAAACRCRGVEIGDAQVDVLSEQVRQLGEDSGGIEVGYVTNENAGLSLCLAECLAEQLSDEGAFVECCVFVVILVPRQS